MGSETNNNIKGDQDKNYYRFLYNRTIEWRSRSPRLSASVKLRPNRGFIHALLWWAGQCSLSLSSLSTSLAPSVSLSRTLSCSLTLSHSLHLSPRAFMYATMIKEKERALERPQQHLHTKKTGFTAKLHSPNAFTCIVSLHFTP